MHHKMLIIPAIILSFTCLTGCQKEKAHIDFETYLELASNSPNSPQFYTKEHSGEDNDLTVLNIIKQGTTDMKSASEKDYDENLDYLAYVIHYYRYEGYTYFSIRIQEDGILTYSCGTEGFTDIKKQATYCSIDANKAKEMITSVNTHVEQVSQEIKEEREQAMKDGSIENFFAFMDKTNETKNVLYYKEKTNPGDAGYYTYYDADNKVLNDLKALDYEQTKRNEQNPSEFYDSIFKYCVSSTSWSLSISKNYTIAAIFYPYQGKHDPEFVSIYYKVDADAVHQIDTYLREQVGADNI